MKLYAGSLAAVLSLALSGPARAQEGTYPCAAGGVDCWSPTTGRTERPSNGVDALAGGGALTAIGALSFATAPICKSRVVNAPEQGACFTASFLVGAPFIVLGIPLLVLGSVQHARYDDWARKHPTLTGLSFAPASGGGGFFWSGRF